MATIAVIGGAGFIGFRLCSLLLARDRTVRSIDSRPNAAETSSASPHLTNHVIDIRDLAALTDVLKGADSIINLAAVHRDDVRPISLYDEVNVQGSRNVCEAARRNGIRQIIFTSSVAVYGFSPRNTDETGELNYFNDYGRTKAEAEGIYRTWQSEDPDRSLVIIRPTVVFGEANRGNVYNLLAQIASGRFLMVGNGKNVKSMAYVENVAAFAAHSLSFGPGVHLYNYVDKPDMTMNQLVSLADRVLGRNGKKRIRFPYWLGYTGGLLADLAARITGRTFAISSIRVKKFCSDTQFAADHALGSGFLPPVDLGGGLERTIRYEFVEDHAGERTFETE